MNASVPLEIQSRLGTTLVSFAGNGPHLLSGDGQIWQAADFEIIA